MFQPSFWWFIGFLLPSTVQYVFFLGSHPSNSTIIFLENPHIWKNCLGNKLQLFNTSYLVNIYIYIYIHYMFTLYNKNNYIIYMHYIFTIYIYIHTICTYYNIYIYTLYIYILTKYDVLNNCSLFIA